MSVSATLPQAYRMATAARGAVEPGTASVEQRRALDQFLASVERRAFRIARLGLRSDDDALDAVQDAMLQLVRAYGAKPAAEWPPLFYRILGNRVRDLQRRGTVRGRVFAWRPMRGDDDQEVDPIESAPSGDPGPVQRLELDEAMGRLDELLTQLAPRQREAFLLRNYEGLDVAATAVAMGCSEGSVKTHYFRAVSFLRTELGEYWR